MPASFRIDQDRRIVVSTLEGPLTDQDLLEHVAGLRADPAFCPGFHHLVDGRGITGIQVSSATIRQLAEIDPFGGESRRAIVTRTDEGYGIARMFQNLAPRGEQMVVVRDDLAEAARWLELD